MKVKFMVLALCAVLITMMLTVSVCADEEKVLSGIGTVNTQSADLNIRSGAGTQFSIVTTVAKNSKVFVEGIAENSAGEKWYKISANGYTGYARADFIIFKEIAPGDESAFEEEIAAFPESYKAGLRELHKLHPTWKFSALITNISWETLMKNECVIGRNLIQSPKAWMSYEKGAYNWNTNTWYSFDSGNWVQACTEAIAYYLDPRNFFNDSVYQFLTLSDDGSAVDAATIDVMLAGTFMHDAPAGDDMTYAEAIIKASKAAGVSPYLLAARIRLEQGSTGNRLAHGTVEGYEGYYNHFDIGAYAHDGRSAIMNGAIYAKNKGWNSIYKSLLGGAEFLAKSYINVGQNTLYLQKYDVVDGGNGFYGHQYMTNISAAVSECSTLRKAIAGSPAEDTALNFLIPVYGNMPDELNPMPLRTGSANNLLTQLYVEALTFNTAFDRYTYQYETYTTAEFIGVHATASDAEATISGAGVYRLDIGSNEIDVTVTATNGTKRTYSIFIERIKDPNAGSEVTPTEPPSDIGIKTSYKINGTLLEDIPENTAVSKLAVSADGCSVKAYSSDSKEKSASDIMKTGDAVRIYRGSECVQTYYSVVFGDSTGDGKVNSLDLLNTQKHILQMKLLNGEAFLRSADFNRDGNINSLDLLACQKSILGIK